MDEPPPVSPPVQPPARFAPHKLAAEFVSPRSPPTAHPDRVVYGLMQPILGARLLVSDRKLLRGALLPAGLLALFCLLSAIVRMHNGGLHELLRDFYATFALLAPLPSVFLAHHYARLAVTARDKLGFSAAEPCIEPLRTAARRWVKQLLIVAIGLLPVMFVLELVPLVGGPIGRVITALWGLHWIVVDAFDSARTLAPGQTLAQVEALAEQAPRPWFTRLLARAADRLPVGGKLLRWFAARCDRLALPWREEMALIERHPSLMVGFALTTAALLATPVLNLLFRPIVIIGATHVMGRLALEEQPTA